MARSWRLSGLRVAVSHAAALRYAARDTRRWLAFVWRPCGCDGCGIGRGLCEGGCSQAGALAIRPVFQNYNLFPHYTVMKNIIDAPIRVLKRPREQAEARAYELIAQMGLMGNENKVPCELSGGQQ